MNTIFLYGTSGACALKDCPPPSTTELLVGCGIYVVMALAVPIVLWLFKEKK